MLEELRAGAYGEDNRPCWIGAYRPSTTCEELRPLAEWAAAHYAYYLTFVREFMQQRGRILDIGSGCGQNTAMLARYGNALGCEPEIKGFDFAMKHNRASGALFVNARFPSLIVRDLGPYDYIFCIETMEHVAYDNQEAFVRDALGMLKSDGRMFITTPNETTPSGPHCGIWSPDWCEKIRGWFGERIVRWGRFSNTKPDAGFVDEGGTHHALVLK